MILLNELCDLCLWKDIYYHIQINVYISMCGHIIGIIIMIECVMYLHLLNLKTFVCNDRYWLFLLIAYRLS